MKISLIMPGRDNLIYAKWSYASVRKHHGKHEVEICFADDNSSDGTWEWCIEMMKIDPLFKAIRNDSGQRLGHTILYDKLINEVCTNEVAMIWHCDMYLCPGALDEIEKLMYTSMRVEDPINYEESYKYKVDKITETFMNDNINNTKIRIQQHSGSYITTNEDGTTDLCWSGWILPVTANYKTIVSLTRIEPPLHPPGPEKIILDCGTEPENFDEYKLLDRLKYFKDKRGKPLNANTEPLPETTNGIFAPWAFFVKDFQEIGGHDPLYRPQSKEDSIYGDTPIFSISGGKLNLKTVEELWDIYSTKIELRDDGKEIINLRNNDISVICPRVGGIIGREKLNGLIRHRVEANRLRKIRTKWGEVVVTDDHSLITDALECITPSNYSDDIKLWKPNLFSDWVRRDNITELDMNTVSNIKLSMSLPIIYNIDEYGNDSQLHDICEFLGFFTADGGAYDSTIKISENDIKVVQNIKNKSISLFGSDLFYGYRVDVTDEGVDTHVYYFTNSEMARWLNDILGSRCGDKKIPDFIYNLPKVYQLSYLYGYLLGDGHLGKHIIRNKVETSITMDPILFFSPNIFKFCYWKSTSSSSKLTSGIYFLLKRCFQDHHFRISFQDYKGNNGVWNISSLQTDYKDEFVEITNYKSGDEYTYVYDLDVRNTNMFIGGIGFIGLHNSDIFNRFKLSNFKFIQTWKGCVYHITCRGSRFSPVLTTPGVNSTEWETHNQKSARNFIRKWGHFVQHTELMDPIVPHKYDIGFIISNGNLNLLHALEPWASKIYISPTPNLSNQTIREYIKSEDTYFPLTEKFVDNECIDSDIRIYIDGNRFTQEDFVYIQNISDIITDSGVENCKMHIGSMLLDIKNIKSIENSLIKIKTEYN